MPGTPQRRENRREGVVGPDAEGEEIEEVDDGAQARGLSELAGKVAARGR